MTNLPPAAPITVRKTLQSFTRVVTVSVALTIHLILVSAPVHAQRLKSTAQDEAAIKNLIRQGVISINEDKRHLYILPSAWEAVDFEGKKAISYKVSVFIATQQKEDRYDLTIFDKHSGKRIARLTGGELEIL